MIKKKSAKLFTVPDSELALWCKVLSESSVAADVVPKGWYTCKEIAKARSRSECSTSTNLMRMVESGSAERKMFTIKLCSQTRPVPHYRLK
jgi:hypothetical protein